MRGIAILLVVTVHCFGWPPGGALGVDLFFVLSGFLITTLLLSEYSESGQISLRRFYTRRAMRLLPALGLLLAFYLVVATLKGQHGLKTVLLGGLFLGNIVQAFTSDHSLVTSSGLAHLWSLAEEEQFYLLWPLLLPIVARRRRPTFTLFTLALALVVYKIGWMAAGAPHYRLYNGPDTHSEGLVAGGGIAFLLARSPSYRLPRAAIGLAVLLVGVFLLARQPLPRWDAIMLPLAEAACLMLLIAVLTLPAWRHALSIRPLTFLGRISYSLYLWHYVLVWAFNGRFGGFVALLSIGVAYTSTRYAEEPLRRQLGRTVDARVPAAIASTA
jgi:peptidoglycan/LPS O-acetylase OafA/YrhL